MMRRLLSTILACIAMLCARAAAEPIDTAFLALPPATVVTEIPVSADRPTSAQPPVVRKHMRQEAPELSEKVVVNGDTVANVMRERNWGRFDRGLYNYLYIPRGRWAFGLTASYGGINTEDLQLLSILTDVSLSGKLYSIKPSVSYFINNNQQVGLRVDFTRGTADLNSLKLDFDEDMNFALSDVSYYSNTFAMAAFYRNYVGLDRSRRFSVFNEIDLRFGSGASRFKRIYDGAPRDTRTNTTQISLNFSPGVCVFIQEYAAFQVSFGVFGLNLNRQRQITDGVDEGTRITSGANFKFNLFNINFGLMIVI